MTPLVIGSEEREALHRLRELAGLHPVDMPRLMESIKTPKGKRRHMEQMDSQTLDLPAAFRVTFSVETGHPAGPCLHLSVSVDREGRIPTPEAVWMIAVELGFVVDLQSCASWPETIDRDGKPHTAINLVQPLFRVAPPDSH